MKVPTLGTATCEGCGQVAELHQYHASDSSGDTFYTEWCDECAAIVCAIIQHGSYGAVGGDWKSISMPFAEDPAEIWNLGSDA